MAQSLMLPKVAVTDVEKTDERAHGGLSPQQAFYNRVWCKPIFMHYYRLAALVITVNLYFAITALSSAPLQWVQNIILANFAMAIIVRFQPTINLLFKVATAAPTSWPLSVRWTLGKVYHFGGLHVGAFLSGSLWMFYHTFAVVLDGQVSMAYQLMVGIHSIILAVMMLVALPQFRHKHHNEFEVIARFGSWISLTLFWIQTLFWIKTSQGDLSFLKVATQPQALVLLLLTFCVVFPWLKLKKVKVDIKKPSNHVALSKFNYGVKPFAGSSTELSRSPLFEWHSFANVPSPHEDGYRLTISRAGDWTGQYIDDAPEHIWVKGIPTAGVGNIEKLFKRVVWVATGSGIGPCLPHLLKGEVPAHLIWATRTPEKTYGKELVDEVLACDPNAIIWNTDEKGKPDMVELAYQAYKQFDAEAVICISNKKLTWKVVEGMESRGIPAYGAIWDS